LGRVWFEGKDAVVQPAFENTDPGVKIVPVTRPPQSFYNRIAIAGRSLVLARRDTGIKQVPLPAEFPHRTRLAPTETGTWLMGGTI
jgi:hypothetical protein